MHCIIRPSDVYSSKEDVIEALGEDYYVISFRQPQKGDKILLSTNVITEVVGFPRNSPRFIVVKREKETALDYFWE